MQTRNTDTLFSCPLDAAICRWNRLRTFALSPSADDDFERVGDKQRVGDKARTDHQGCDRRCSLNDTQMRRQNRMNQKMGIRDETKDRIIDLDKRA